MDQMLHTDEGLRVEEIVLPVNFPPTPLAGLIQPARDYLLMALHEHDKWVFNPADDHVLTAGTTLILMASPGARSRVEKLLNT
jgi:voltage-gated potassium channel